jgi:hypothetical protein
LGTEMSAAIMENRTEVPQKPEIELPSDPAVQLLNIPPK